MSAPLHVVLASHNPKKIRELQGLFDTLLDGAVTVRSLSDIGYTEEIPETGDLFVENALQKALAITGLGYVAVADDSGLEVDALDGAPGVYSARYAGEPCDNAKNNEKLLAALASTPDEARTARFRSVIVCLFPDGRAPIVADGACEGVILREPRGDGGFGYDPLFYTPALGKTFAEATAAEKDSVSHRGVAMRKLAAALGKRLTPKRA